MLLLRLAASEWSCRVSVDALRIPTGELVFEKSRFILYFLKTIEQILSLSIGAANRVRR